MDHYRTCVAQDALAPAAMRLAQSVAAAAAAALCGRSVPGGAAAAAMAACARAWASAAASAAGGASTSGRGAEPPSSSAAAWSAESGGERRLWRRGDVSLVLVHPRIPQNAGNVARTAAGTGVALHLVAPLGFELDDRK
jgi:hypothetical protein